MEPIYPTLTAQVELLLCSYFAAAGTREDVRIREEAALQAITLLVEGNLKAIRAMEWQKIKSAMTAGTVHDGKRKNP